MIDVSEWIRRVKMTLLKYLESNIGNGI